MTSIGSTGGGSANVSTPATRGHRAAKSPSPDDVRAMRQAFGQARPMLQETRPQAHERGLGTRASALAKADTAVIGAQEQQAHEPLAGVTGREKRGGALVDEGDRDQDHAATGLGTTAQQPVAPLAIPAMPAPHVDASAFAQLMTDLWLRERGKGSKEVRVSFGRDAWPATGARLFRNAAGALDIQLHVDARGDSYEAVLPDLRDELGNRGLAIGALRLSDAAV
jgi:hypothetical protein